MVQQQLPCDGDGLCMLCKSKPTETETLTCKTCVTPWHSKCLSALPQTLASTLEWECLDCSLTIIGDNVGVVGSSRDLIAAIRAVEADDSLTDRQKAVKRQELVSGVVAEDEKKEKWGEESELQAMLDESFKCSFCMQLPEKPVTTPCGHNFCLRCFQKWIRQGNRTCAKCRRTIPEKMASQPRINPKVVDFIRKMKTSKIFIGGGPVVYHFMQNESRPETWFTTARAKKTGKANACSGKIFVTIPPDHFGPIPPENDPYRSQGVLVGESWEDRMDCRQWGAHLPHIAGIAGQSNYGAQSVALSGGYEDDEDHGEWFLYTGSGGRDLSGNKRTNKLQSSDQKFEKMNEALRVSSNKGYPVRVVRSHKEKRSSYAPENGVRYDGVYRIEKCWRKIGIQGFKVCRYLFVRCDNEPAPWTSDEHGDRPRPLPAINELKKATDITERKESPSWDYDEEEHSWKWKKSPPLSRKPVNTANPEDLKIARKTIRHAQNISVREQLLKGFSCSICRKIMTFPVTTPCAHNFCKPCLEEVFSGQTHVTKRICAGGRTLRERKNVMNCPSCPNDISDFLQDLQVNIELMDVIESLQCKAEEISENVGDSSREKAEIAELPEAVEVKAEINSDNSEVLVDGNSEITEEETPPSSPLHLRSDAADME